MKRATRARCTAAAAASVVALGAFGALPALAADDATGFHRTATYPVFQNVPAGVDPAAPTVAEISAASKDGKTLVYTDALGQRIGFLDLTDPSAPAGLGTVSLAELGHADDQPTSVSIVGGYVLVVIDETGGDFTNPTGRLDVLRLADRERVASIDLGGQPDSIAISNNGKLAAIAIENQRDEEFTPEGSDEEGDLPQPPAGFLQLIELGADPATWTAEPIALTKPDGSALDAFVQAGLHAPEDPEPEYVSFSPNGTLAVSLQENNGIAVVDPKRGAVRNVFSTGAVSGDGFDTTKDKVIAATGSLDEVSREPDSIGWVTPNLIATANEGDLFGGTRGWSIFDVRTGGVVWDAGNTFEQLAIAHGVYNDDRAAKKGPEPEGLAIAEFDGIRYAFVASERSNIVVVYDLSDPTEPVFVQTLFATNGPEGILPIPGRDLLVVSSEADDAEIGVRASVNVYEFGDGAGAAGQPSIVSDTETDGEAIGWQALGALTADPTDAGTLYAASDAAVKPSTIFTVDVTGEPARITDALAITSGGVPANLDVEGLFARPQGGYWLAVEGATGPGNAIVRTDAAGAIVQTTPLPADISAHLGKWGLEGVTAVTDDAGAETVYVAVQRPLWADPAAASGPLDGEGVTRIGRYDVATGAWTWLGYRLEATATAGDWLGLSEIVAVDADTLAVIERDKLNGPAAAVKRVYTVELDGVEGIVGMGEPGALPMLEKSLAIDVLPALQSVNGWTQEKLEGLTIGADGDVYAVTDNDGLKDATGETVFLRLGDAGELFSRAAR